MPMIVRSRQQFRGAAPAGIREDGRMLTVGLRAQASAMRVQARDQGQTAGALGQAVDQLGVMLHQRDQKLQQARAESERTDALMRARKVLDDVELAVEQSNRFDGVLEEFDETAADLRKSVLDGMSDSPARAAVAQDLDEIVRQRRLKVRRAINRREIDFQTAKLDADLIDLAGAAAASTGAERDTMVRAASDRLKVAVQTGIVAPTDMVDRLQDFRNDLDEADVRRLISTAPEAAMQALDDPERFKALAPDRRAVLADMAARRLETDLNRERREDERAERERDEAIKAEGQAAMKHVMALNADNQLTRGDIEERRELLTASQYGAALKLLQGDSGGKQDPDTLVDLYTRVNRLPDQAEAAALIAFEAGQINQATLNTITARAEAARQRAAADGRRAPELPRDYVLADDYVQRALRPSGMLNDEAANERYAEAMMQFQTAADEMLAQGRTDGFREVAKQVVKQSGNALGGMAALPTLNFMATPRSFADPVAVQGVLRDELNAVEVQLARGRISAEAAAVMRANVGRWAAELKRRAPVGGDSDAE